MNRSLPSLPLLTLSLRTRSSTLGLFTLTDIEVVFISATLGVAAARLTTRATHVNGICAVLLHRILLLMEMGPSSKKRHSCQSPHCLNSQ
ncbi:hypothetical protein BDR07DRAFT_1391861 [Suillus spraguei]|nr:hypothetical protein BDR07DRAFT_1391861 [Suillus spraguei]